MALPNETINPIVDTDPVDVPHAKTPHDQLLENDQDLDNRKIDKVAGSGTDNIAIFKFDGGIKDSGKKIFDFAPSSHVNEKATSSSFGHVKMWLVGNDLYISTV